jgi:WD40 repeat protein
VLGRGVGASENDLWRSNLPAHLPQRGQPYVMFTMHAARWPTLSILPGPFSHDLLAACVRVYVCYSGGKLLKRLPNFQKTVTCVTLSPLAGPETAAAPRLLAGSLDGHVKIFELDTFKVTHASKYPAPVLSLGLSPDCGTLAVGMADGTLSIRSHAKPRLTEVSTCRCHADCITGCMQHMLAYSPWLLVVGCMMSSAAPVGGAPKPWQTSTPSVSSVA